MTLPLRACYEVAARRLAAASRAGFSAALGTRVQELHIPTHRDKDKALLDTLRRRLSDAPVSMPGILPVLRQAWMTRSNMRDVISSPGRFARVKAHRARQVGRADHAAVNPRHGHDGLGVFDGLDGLDLHATKNWSLIQSV